MGTTTSVTHFCRNYLQGRELSLVGANAANMLHVGDFCRDMPSGLRLVQWSARSAEHELDEITTT